MEHRNYILLICVVLLFMVIPNIVAQPTYQQSLPVNVSVPCIIDGAFCTTALCNATVVNPDGITLHNNEPMIQNGSVYNLELTASDTSVKGEYGLTIYCKQGGKETTKTLVFFVQSLAKKYGTSILTFDFTETINLIIAIILVLISLTAFIIKSYTLSGSLLALLGLMFLFSQVHILVSALFIIIGILVAVKE